MKKIINISVVGAAGKMGKQILLKAMAFDHFNLVGAIEAKGSKHLGKDVSSIVGGDRQVSL